jgi:hopene-associated glycosyltransferase HpnB
MTLAIIAVSACAVWAYLLTMRGGFWCARDRDDRSDAPAITPTPWPSVVAIVPARNEAGVIGIAVASLLAQDYPGRLRVVVVDDHSTDGTATVARGAAAAAKADDRLTVLSAPDLPAGWTGKPWAMHAGTAHVDAMTPAPDYLLFTDADIDYVPHTLGHLVMRAESRGLALTSLMAKLRVDSAAERALVPAFIFFFQMLYPFAWVNDPKRSMAAAAGGCMLVRRASLAASGGIAAIRSALIDDCALARNLKHQGPIWLGLTQRARSLRASESFSDLQHMVRRSAYAQLKYSPLLLLATALAMMLAYLAPPLLTILTTGVARWAGAAAWGMMALAFAPTLAFYGVSRWWGVFLPAIAGVYLVFTLESAWQHGRGRGGLWKGRTYVPARDRR